MAKFTMPLQWVLTNKTHSETLDKFGQKAVVRNVKNNNSKKERGKSELTQPIGSHCILASWHPDVNLDRLSLD